MKSIVTFLLIIVVFGANAQDELLTDRAAVDREFHDLVKAMPSPIKELEDLRNDHVKYDEHLLSPAGNVSNYESDVAEAINCGIYLVDFAYLAVFHEQDKMIEYRALGLELASKLDAAEPFHDMLAVDLEHKVKDHEKLKAHIENALYATEDYLIDNNHLATASQMLLGSWVETQYILLHSFIREKRPSDVVKQHIVDQQIYLASLIELVSEFKDEAGMHNELERLNQLEESFKKLHTTADVTDLRAIELVDEITVLRMDILAME
ncbi:hypothetical protein N9R81_05770 [Flavobacteriales bacterium]|nr:hypothetical protein [Flavobacteriales bacterium]